MLANSEVFHFLPSEIGLSGRSGCDIILVRIHLMARLSKNPNFPFFFHYIDDKFYTSSNW